MQNAHNADLGTVIFFKHDTFLHNETIKQHFQS